MVISSLLVETDRSHIEEVQALLNTIEGVEVHDVFNGYIVITIEAAHTTASQKIAQGILELEYVENIYLTYADFEEDEELQKLWDKQESYL